MKNFEKQLMNTLQVNLFIYLSFLSFLFYSEEISENTIFNANDIKRFNEIDDYASMFIKHAKHGKAFDLKRAFRIFHDAMIWRKQSNIYG